VAGDTVEPYCFGRFTLDSMQRTLCMDGTPVPLGITDFNLLCVLVERAGDVVPKEDLMRLVWGRTAVSDNALYVHVNALRKALGEDCIVNKQGRGYRFVLPVRRTEPQRPPRPQTKPRLGNLPSLSAGSLAGNPTRLIGRSEHLRLVSSLLAAGRLVTLTGPGGVGKTRLALQAASEASPDFSDGVWLVELATLSDPELVAGAIAVALGIQIGANARTLDALSRRVARKSMLIVLDNCEHVIAACAGVVEALLAAAPDVKILATSREPLSCSGEQIFDLPALAVPSETATPALMRGVAALDLFIERAKEADANFQLADDELAIVARICRRVDGLPLAIEIAAAWASPLGLEMLEERLDGSFKALRRARSTTPLRHSTLHASLEWSFGLLSAAEQTVLCRLAAFAGGFSIDAAEAVAGDDVVPPEQVFEHVADLTHKSMIAVVPGSQPRRYRLLETTRAFMFEELAASSDRNLVRHRHARYVLDVLERANRELETMSDTAWPERYSLVLDDLRTALDWAMNEDRDLAVALAGASGPLWRELSLRAEGRERLSAAVTKLHSGTPPELQARLGLWFGEVSLHSTDIRSAHEEIARAVTLYRELGNQPNLGSALTALGFTLLTLNRIEEAEQAILEALSLLEPAKWLRTLAKAYSTQSCIEAIRGRFDAAGIAGEHAVRLGEMIGADRTTLVVKANLAQFSLEGGDVDAAVSAGRSLAAQLRDTRHSYLFAFVLGLLVSALVARRDLDEALIVAREAAPLLRDEGWLYWLFDHLALRAGLGGRVKDAALIDGYTSAVYEECGRTREPMGRRAVERLTLVLSDALPAREITQLRRLGAQLTEDQVLSLALSG